MQPSPRSLGYATDLAVIGPGARISRADDHWVVRSPQNPGHYWGNFLLYDRPPAAGDLARWEAAFTAAFADEPRVVHRAFGWDDPAGTPGAIAEFEAAGYQPNVGEVLATDAARPAPHPRPDLDCRALATDAEWAAATALQIATRAEGFDLEPYARFKTSRMAMYREMVAAGEGQWFGAFAGDRLLGDMGLFVRDGLGRFQSVSTATDARRQGVCGALLAHVAAQGLGPMGARRLVIVAEGEADAGRVYRSLGFDLAERQLGVARWP